MCFGTCLHLQAGTWPHPRHQALNDVVAKAFALCIRCGPSHIGLVRQGGKRPDGMTLILGQRGNLGRHSSGHASGLLRERDGACSGDAAAEQAAGRKSAKFDLSVQTG